MIETLMTLDPQELQYLDWKSDKSEEWMLTFEEFQQMERELKPTRADYLHALIFGRHSHPCPSDYCNGRERPCSDRFDCQIGPKLCTGCYMEQYAD